MRARRCLRWSCRLRRWPGPRPTRGWASPSANEQQIEAQKLSKVPKQTKFVEAEYPKEAAEKGIEAETVLLLDINAQGKVDSVGVAEPATPPGMGFDEAAMVAAQEFEFEPAELDGKPIAVQLSYRYKFKLKPKAAGGARGARTARPAPGATAPAAPAREPVVNFTGLLRERGTRLPMPGVLVTVFREEEGEPKGFEATTDAEGRFQFFDLAPGEWKVLVEAPGYYPFRTTETIAQQRSGWTSPTTSSAATYNPFDVTVTATRPRKEVSRTVLSAKEIDKVPGAAGDPLAVIQNFAGVARAPFAGQIIVRGSAPEDTQVFVDGATVPLIYHFGGLRSVIPVGMLDSIEFYPGNFSPDVRPGHRRHHRRAGEEAAAAEDRRLRRRQPAGHRRLPGGAHRRQGGHRRRRPAQLHRLHHQRRWCPTTPR